jgi:hypothetical protein
LSNVRRAFCCCCCDVVVVDDDDDDDDDDEKPDGIPWCALPFLPPSPT